jgi:hypothetical protein
LAVNPHLPFGQYLHNALGNKDLMNDRFTGIELAYTATLSATAHQVLAMT